MKYSWLLAVLLACVPLQLMVLAAASASAVSEPSKTPVAATKETLIPAAPIMTLYRFNGDFGIPYYSVSGFKKYGAVRPAGQLAQGTALIPCLVIQKGKPLVNASGTPYVGFEIVLEPQDFKASQLPTLLEQQARRSTLRVKNHHCNQGGKQGGRQENKYVIDARRLIHRFTQPFSLPAAALTSYTPTPSGPSPEPSLSDRRAIVQKFHNSTECNQYTAPITQRRAALARAWTEFSERNVSLGKAKLKQARQLDYVMRTTLYEGHLGRGCSAYGACERNVIALSIRNRARGQCAKYQGCGYAGDFEGVAAMVSQYNIWDEYLTQISGLATCFLRADLAGDAKISRLQKMYSQSAGQVERILFGENKDLLEIFSGNGLSEILKLRHYYHPPAMGKCFPEHERVEYISAATAKKGKNYVVLINTRIGVGDASAGGYLFNSFHLDQEEEGDSVQLAGDFPGFIVDGRKISLTKSTSCTPYGVNSGCQFESVGRYRKPAYWLKKGKALRLSCAINDSGKSCLDPSSQQSVTVGGKCDVDMQPVAGVR